jgi:thiol-disulfide isomerase/thioredoxin
MMKLFNKYFFIGMATGVVLVILIICVGGYFVYKQVSKNSLEQIKTELLPPSFPEKSRIAIYGQADYSWPLRTLDGRETTLSEFRDKVVFINLWATWCMPCVAEMPNIQSLYDSLKSERVAFLLISNEPKETVKKFLNDKKFTFPVYLCNKELPIVFKTMGIPATFILSRDGSVVFKEVGSAKWDDVSSLNFLRGLM